MGSGGCRGGEGGRCGANKAVVTPARRVTPRVRCDIWRLTVAAMASKPGLGRLLPAASVKKKR